MRVTTQGQNQAALLNLQRATTAQADAGARVATGRRGDDLRAFGGAAEGVAALRTVQARVEAWTGAADRLSARLESQDLFLGEVEAAAGDARLAITEALGNGAGTGLMDALEAAFGRAAQALNGEHEGEPLFAGARTDGRPFEAARLADLTAAADPAALFRDDGVQRATRLGEATVVASGERASAVGGDLAAAFRGVQAYVEANGPFGKPLTDAQRGFLTTQLQAFASAQSGVTQAVARNGAVQARVADAADGLSARSASLTGLFEDRVGVDPARAISDLEAARVAVQASAQVFTLLRGSSLLDLLR